VHSFLQYIKQLTCYVLQSWSTLVVVRSNGSIAFTSLFKLLTRPGGSSRMLSWASSTVKSSFMQSWIIIYLTISFSVHYQGIIHHDTKPANLLWTAGCSKVKISLITHLRSSCQIPTKFFFFKKIVSLFYTHVFTEPESIYGKSTQLSVTFASGYLVGVICAIVSHPADLLISLLGKAEHKGKSVGVIASEVGFGTLATKGLGTRVIMISQLVLLFLLGSVYLAPGELLSQPTPLTLHRHS